MCVQEIFIEISLFEPIQLILHFLIRTKKKKKKKMVRKPQKFFIFLKISPTPSIVSNSFTAKAI